MQNHHEFVEIRISALIGRSQELRTQCQRITLNPPSYRLRPELGEGIRSCAHGHYVIFFEVESDTVLIVRILHGARDLPTVFNTNEQ